MMLNVTFHREIHREICAPEERDFWGAQELAEKNELPLSRNEAFEFLNGRTFYTMWLDDEIPW